MKRVRFLPLLLFTFLINVQGITQKTGQINKMLDIQSLVNSRYHTYAFSDTVRLHNGIYYYLNDKGIIDSNSYTKLDQRNVAFGDLNGNGIPDAAVIMISSGGGTGLFIDLGIVFNVNGRPVNVATESLGDRVAVKKVFIKDGLINVRLLTHGDQDGQCCPSIDSTWCFKIDLRQLGKPYWVKNKKSESEYVTKLVRVRQ